MSLVHFVERPALRASFNALHRRPGLAPDVAEAPERAPAQSNRYTLVGTAFDYLARFKLAHELGREGRAEIVGGTWIAERSVEAMRGHPALDEHFEGCRRRVENVRRLVAAYVAGDAARLREVASAAQWLAHLDSLHRTGELRRPHVGLDLRVHEELLALADAFEPALLFAGARRVLLNPVYAEAALVEGADPDLVIDDGIVDIKTTTRLRVEPAHLRQLAGYAVMQRLGGIELADGRHAGPARWVGIYFARHGVLQRWAVDEILPGPSFERYLEAFRGEAATLARQAA